MEPGIWLMSVNPVVGKLRQETFSKPKASLGYTDIEPPLEMIFELWWGLGNAILSPYLQRPYICMHREADFL